MRLLCTLALCLGLYGCFDPSLGTTPMLCASSGDKKCPDGYTCQTVKKQNVCVKDGIQLDSTVLKPDRRFLTDGELLPSKDSDIYLDGAIYKTRAEIVKCLDKDSEPNNSGAALVNGKCEVEAGCATEAHTGSVPDWEICYPGDVDQYWITLKQGQRLKVQVVGFFNKNGDLDAALVDPSGNLLDASRSTRDFEELNLSSAPKDGRYVFAVFGFGPAVNTYNLTVSVE
jgi:hypothetical protein